MCMDFTSAHGYRFQRVLFSSTFIFMGRTQKATCFTAQSTLMCIQHIRKRSKHDTMDVQSLRENMQLLPVGMFTSLAHYAAIDHTKQFTLFL